MGTDKWNKVIKFLKTSNANPEKVLNMLKTIYSKRTGPESDYEVVRNSWAYIVVGAIANKTGTPIDNKKRTTKNIIRNWIKTKQYESDWRCFHMKKVKNKKSNKVEWDQGSYEDFKKISKEKHVKQLNDVWVSKNGKKIRATLTPGGKFPISDHSKKVYKFLSGE
jgi:hypothetical protein|tara:strand:- start:146 stop:640 length:495 start_codon:yes stop_codon:yes gene_type:complete